jgi:hypothetical protein
MKLYACYIKSHCEAPDWEREADAKNFNEAVDIFTEMANREAEETTPKDFIAENTWSFDYQETCPKCKRKLKFERKEKKGIYKMIGKCLNCHYKFID